MKDVSTDKVKEEVELNTDVEIAEELSTDKEKEETADEVGAEPEVVEETSTLSVAELQQKLDEALAKADENHQKLLRAQADFDNFRRRTRKEKEDQAKYASLSLVEQLLPALDNFERALEASKSTQDMDSLVKGIEMVYKQLDQALVGEGLEVIPSVGEAFDPHYHQAVMQVESDEFESGYIVEELQKGYKLKDKVIRPAMVKVRA